MVENPAFKEKEETIFYLKCLKMHSIYLSHFIFISEINISLHYPPPHPIDKMEDIFSFLQPLPPLMTALLDLPS